MDELDNGNEKPILSFKNKALWTWLMLFILCAVGWFYTPYAKPEEVFLTNNWFMIFFFCMMAFWNYEGLVYRWKYNAPQLVGNNLHGSTLGKPIIEKGMVLVYTLGDIYWLNLPGKEGTVIVPKRLVSKEVGNNVSCPVYFKQVPPECVDYTIAPEVLQDSRCHPPYWQGYFSTTLTENVSEVPYISDHIEKANAHMARLNAMLNDKIFKNIEEWENFKNITLHTDRKLVAETNAMKQKIRENMVGF